MRTRTPESAPPRCGRAACRRSRVSRRERPEGREGRLRPDNRLQVPAEEFDEAQESHGATARAKKITVSDTKRLSDRAIDVTEPGGDGGAGNGRIGAQFESRRGRQRRTHATAATA